MLKALDKVYNKLLWLFAMVLFALYILYSGMYYAMPENITRYACLIYSIIISLGFIFFYRRKNLFCPEVLILIVFVFSSFFNEIILKNLDSFIGVSRVFSTAFNENIENKGLLVQTLSLTLFVLGATRVKKISENDSRIIQNKFSIQYNFRPAVLALNIIIGLYLIVLAGLGVISSWFHYSSSTNYTNTSIVYLTIMFLVSTTLEFSRLYKIKVHDIRSFIKRINKIYLIEILAVAFLLMVSGNRNEALLIILPPIAGYSIFIHRFSNRFFLICAAVGSCIMILIGVTRQQEVSIRGAQESTISLFEVGRDYGYVDISTKYLIEYTDKNSPILFNNAVINLFSSVPLLGGVYVVITGTEYDTRSTELTTLGMQEANNMDSGLGTSLVGDLYYTGEAFFTFLFMYAFGYFISYLYKRFFIIRDYNIWLLVIYLFLFSNALYCIRAEWTMPFRYLGFSFVLIFVLLPFTKTRIYHG